MSSLNPGVDEELQASFRKWNAIESGYCPPAGALQEEMRCVYYLGLDFDIRRYNGEPLTDPDIGGCFALHKQISNKYTVDSYLTLNLEYREIPVLVCFPEFEQMRAEALLGVEYTDNIATRFEQYLWHCRS